MGTRVPVLYMAAILTAGCGAATDLYCHKIYNKLTISSAMAGVLLNYFFNGISGLINSFLGIFLGIICMSFWIMGMLKAGDVKLYMAIGALAGWHFCGNTIVFSIMVGGVVSAILMAVRKSGRASFRHLGIYLMNLFYTRQYHRYIPETENAYFSFGCCIFAGTLISLWK